MEAEKLQIKKMLKFCDYRRLYYFFGYTSGQFPKMLLFAQRDGWMQFAELDVQEDLEMAFAIGWRFTDDSSDDWTTRFNRFKSKYPAALKGAKKMMESAVPGLVELLALDTSKTIFVPVPSSAETNASPNGPISDIARTCAFAQVHILFRMHSPKNHIVLCMNKKVPPLEKKSWNPLVSEAEKWKQKISCCLMTSLPGEARYLATRKQFAKRTGRTALMSMAYVYARQSGAGTFGRNAV